MLVVNIVRTSRVERTARVMQLEGLFEIPPTKQSESRWSAELPIEAKPWSIGLIVGPSGSGKTTLARELFADCIVDGFSWHKSRSIVDGFPRAMGVKEITSLLSSVGFSSPPAWLRPFDKLSTGEQFRVTIARALSEPREVTVIDEFTSVVDRTVARIGSAAVAKAVRRRSQKLIAVSCHYDVIDWLQPDWVFDVGSGRFQWRRLRRHPEIKLEVFRTSYQSWELFKHHHYLNTRLNRSARCFVATLEDGRPVAFASAMSQPGSRNAGWREHRTVCLPDFQGVGIGNAMSAFVARVMASLGKPYYSATSNPAMVRHRAKSAFWKMTRPPSQTNQHCGSKTDMNATGAAARLTAGFKWMGPRDAEAARAFGVLTVGATDQKSSSPPNKGSARRSARSPAESTTAPKRTARLRLEPAGRSLPRRRRRRSTPAEAAANPVDR